MTDHVGRQVGNYHLISLLGQGGFAEVYLGEHIYLGSKAAIKLLNTQFSESVKGVAGTAVYMAPEQFQGKPRPASDQYALGVVIYEWLCGVHPFKGTFVEIVSQHLFVPPPSLLGKNPTITPDIEQVVMT